MPVTANGFVKTRPELERPDAQCLFQPTSILARPWFPGVRKPEADVVAMACVQLRPEGRGWVRLASADPSQPPRILTNVLSTENDRAFFRRVIPQMREILATAPLADVVKSEVMPGPADDLDAWTRANVRTAMHAAGSCAMGTGPDAVCDAELKVRGLEGLGNVAALVGAPDRCTVEPDRSVRPQRTQGDRRRGVADHVDARAAVGVGREARAAHVERGRG